jgi:hypothetical protein
VEARIGGQCINGWIDGWMGFQVHGEWMDAFGLFLAPTDHF